MIKRYKINSGWPVPVNIKKRFSPFGEYFTFPIVDKGGFCSGSAYSGSRENNIICFYLTQRQVTGTIEQLRRIMGDNNPLFPNQRANRSAGFFNPYKLSSGYTKFVTPFFPAGEKYAVIIDDGNVTAAMPKSHYEGDKGRAIEIFESVSGLF